MCLDTSIRQHASELNRRLCGGGQGSHLSVMLKRLACQICVSRRRSVECDGALQGAGCLAPGPSALSPSGPAATSAGAQLEASKLNPCPSAHSSLGPGARFARAQLDAGNIKADISKLSCSGLVASSASAASRVRCRRPGRRRIARFCSSGKPGACAVPAE